MQQHSSSETSVFRSTEQNNDRSKINNSCYDDEEIHNTTPLSAVVTLKSKDYSFINQQTMPLKTSIFNAEKFKP